MNEQTNSGGPPITVTGLFRTLVPRSPGRISPTLHVLETLWREYPDMRLGQLIGNALREVGRDADLSTLLNIEDEAMTFALGACYGRWASRKLGHRVEP